MRVIVATVASILTMCFAFFVLATAQISPRALRFFSCRAFEFRETKMKNVRQAIVFLFLDAAE